MWDSGTIRIGRIKGIAIDVHLTFGLIIAWGAWQGWAEYGGLEGIAYGILAILLLFGCILVHELAHALQARAFGLVVRRITLLPIGGLAQLETPPSYPWHELVIALVGPLANLGLAVLFGGLLFVLYPAVLSGWQSLVGVVLAPGSGGLLFFLLAANLTLFLFNMIPAFPMDGGRVLRAGLALVADYLLATRVAAWFGRIIAAGMCVVGIFGLPFVALPPNPLLALVAVMVYLGAHQEELHVRRQWALTRVEVNSICQHSAESIAPWDVLTDRIIARLARHETVLPVLVDGRVVGLLGYGEARRFAGRDDPATAAHAMRTDFPVLRLRDTLWVAMQEMIAFRIPALPVTDHGLYCGIVTLDDINHAWRFVPQQTADRGRASLSGDKS